MKNICITGSSGFIGFHLTKKLIEAGYNVTGIDHLRPSYGGNLSELRMNELKRTYGLNNLNIDLGADDLDIHLNLFSEFDVIFHLAAYPGVRNGEIDPFGYHRNNISSFAKICELASKTDTPKVYFASSSSIYGKVPEYQEFHEDMGGSYPLLSYYALTKWINELEGRKFAQLGKTSFMALRFFSVYGPWGRPDMAYFKFAKSIIDGLPIKLYGENGGIRNFSYIDDVVEILLKLLVSNPVSNFEEINVASGSPISTLDMVSALATVLEKKNFQIDRVSRPLEDMEFTSANYRKLNSLIGLSDSTPLLEGLKSFVTWYKETNGRIIPS